MSALSLINYPNIFIQCWNFKIHSPNMSPVCLQLASDLRILPFICSHFSESRCQNSHFLKISLLQWHEGHCHLSHIPSTDSNQMLVLPSEIDTSLMNSMWGCLNEDQDEKYRARRCVCNMGQWDKQILSKSRRIWWVSLVKMKAVLMLLFPWLLYSTFKLPWFIETSKAISLQSVIFTWQDN